MKPNVILITIDDARADHFGFLGYKKNISPNIDKLALESKVFTRAFSVGPLTPHGFPGILTSTYPLDYPLDPAEIVKQSKRPRVLISEVLQKQGYIAAAFSPNPFGIHGYGEDGDGWDYFEKFEEDKYSFKVSSENIIQKIKSFLEKMFSWIVDFSPRLFFKIRYFLYRLGLWGITLKKVKAEKVNEKLKEFIFANKDESKPFFIWTHYMDVHSPLIPYDVYFKERKLTLAEIIGRTLPTLFFNKFKIRNNLLSFARENLGKSISLYDDGIRYVDEKVGELIEFLKRENVYDNTVIVLTADHGEEFLEHDSMVHNAKLYNELLKVPLLIKTINKGGEKIKKKVSTINIAPTICKLTETESSRSFKGKDLFEEGNETIFHQTTFNLKEKGELPVLKPKSEKDCLFACQDNNWKYIIDYINKKEELYDLIKDQEEKVNLAKDYPTVISEMREKMKEFKKNNPPLFKF